MKIDLLLKTFRNTLLASAYIFLVSQVMLNGEKWFGPANNALGPFVVLLLFSLSAAVVGGLVFLESILLLLDNNKREGLKAAMFSVAWLAVYSLIALSLLFLIN